MILFSDVLIMTTQVKKNIFNIYSRSDSGGVFFKRKFLLYQSTFEELIEESRKGKERVLIMREKINTEKTHYLELVFEDDPKMQSFLMESVSSKQTQLRTQCFGIELSKLQDNVKLEQKRVIPRFIVALYSHILQIGLREEGIFRISSEQKMLHRIMDKINHGEVPLNIINPFDAGNVIKHYFRSLPNSLLGEYIEELDPNTYGKDKANQIAGMQAALNNMPRQNVCTLELIIRLIITIEANKAHNKMSLENLCIVISNQPSSNKRP